MVHACWHPASVDLLRDLDGAGSSVSQIFDIFAKQCRTKIEANSVVDEDEIDIIEQNENPIKVLCSGMEVRAAEPFFAGGKMRNLERAKWWEDYDAADGRLIVIGHYWRRFMDEISPAVNELHPEGFNPTGADMFPG